MISNTVLVLAERFGEGLDAERVAGALALGLQADGKWDCDLCPLDPGTSTTTVSGRAGASAALDALGFDLRMRAARALAIVAAALTDETLADSIAFEAATRARQGGVPAYAVTALDRLDPFEARIMDLQLVIEANSRRALDAAGRRLAELV